MRRALFVMAGLMAVLGFVIGPPSSEALTFNSCFLRDTYTISALGEAAGFVEVLGTLDFTPNADCGGGVFTAELTIKHQGGAGAPTQPAQLAGAYFVTPAGIISFTVTGVVGLTGLVTALDLDRANAFSFVARFEQIEPIVLAGTAVRRGP